MLMRLFNLNYLTILHGQEYIYINFNQFEHQF